MGASAGFANSTAIGAGAVTTAANQFVLGTGSNTYVAPGITSAASLAAQSGPTSFVTTDAQGHLAAASFSPQDITNLSANVGALQQNVTALQHDMRRGFEGTAIAIAMGGSALPEAQKWSLSMNWGTFAGENATAFAAQFRVAPHVVLNAGLGAGFAQHGVGGRAGVTILGIERKRVSSELVSSETASHSLLTTHPLRYRGSTSTHNLFNLKRRR